MKALIATGAAVLAMATLSGLATVARTGPETVAGVRITRPANFVADGAGTGSGASTSGTDEEDWG